MDSFVAFKEKPVYQFIVYLIYIYKILFKLNLLCYMGNYTVR